MTEQPDLPPELLERVAMFVMGPRDPVPPNAVFALEELQRSVWGRASEQDRAHALWVARAVAPMLIAHGRELERATLNQAKVPRKLTHDDFTLPEHRSKP